jgi:hypothetical protein
MKEEKIIQAEIFTKSNYADLNGKFVKVINFCGTLVFCEYEDTDGTKRRCDFSLSEIKKIIEY